MNEGNTCIRLRGTRLYRQTYYLFSPLPGTTIQVLSCNSKCYKALITLFNAQFYPEGLKAYTNTRNLYKQRTQVK